MRRWRRRLLNVSGSIVIIALSICFYNSDDKMVELLSSFCCHTTLLPIVIQKQRIVLRKRSLSQQVSVCGAKIYILVTTPSDTCRKAVWGWVFQKRKRFQPAEFLLWALYCNSATSSGWQIRRSIKREALLNAQSALICIAFKCCKTTVPFLIEKPLWKTAGWRLPDYQC